MTEHKWADVLRGMADGAIVMDRAEFAAFRAAILADAAKDVEPVAWRLDYPPDAGVGLPRFFGADAKPRLANFTSNYNAKQVALYSAATVAALQAQVEALVAERDALREALAKAANALDVRCAFGDADAARAAIAAGGKK